MKHSYIIKRILTIVTLVLLWSGPASHSAAQTCDIAWNVDADGFWDEDGNWDLRRAPQFGERVCIDRSAGDFTISVRTDLPTMSSVHSAETLRVVNGGLVRVSNPSRLGAGLRLEGGALQTTGAGEWWIEGGSQWTAGAINASVLNSGVFTLDSGNDKDLNGRLDNRGQIFHSAGNLRFLGVGAGSALNNLVGGLYEFQGDVQITGAIGGFNNHGALRKSAGEGEARIEVRFHNAVDGLVDVQAGRLVFNGGGRGDGGVFTVAENAVLEWRSWGGKHTGRFTGSGGGKVQIAGNWEAREEGVTLDFPPGMLEWVSGTIGGATCGDAGCSGDVTNAGFLTLVGDTDKTLVRSIFNTGAILHTGAGNLTLSTFGHGIINQVEGLYELRSNAGLLDCCGTFTNRGALRKSAGAGESRMASYFDNLGGTIDVQSGILNLANRGNSTGGVFNVEAGAVLEFSRDANAAAEHSLIGVYTGAGLGKIRHRGYLRGDNSSPPVLNFPARMFEWQSGWIFASVINNGVITLVGDAPKSLRSDLPWTNNGEFIVEGEGTFQYYVTTQFVNNGLFDIRSNANIEMIGVRCTTCTPTLFNYGVLRKSDGVETTFVHDPNNYGTLRLDNQGTVEVQIGAIHWMESVNQITGSTLTGGDWRIDNLGELHFSAGALAENAASVTLIGDAVFANLASLQHNSGHLRLADGHEWSTSGVITNSGVLTVGVQSLLSAMKLTQTTTGRLGFEIGGRPHSGEYGRIQVDGEAQIDGALAIALVNGFGPTTGDIYEIARYAGRQGNFIDELGVAPLFTLEVGDLVMRLTAGSTANDLAVEAILVPATGQPGDVVEITYRARNRGNGPITGRWTDSLYLSHDAVYDPGDVLIGRLEQDRTVAVSDAYTATLAAILPGVADRPYRVIVIADSRGQIPDANRSNNMAASTDTIHISVPVLPYNTLVEVTVAAGEDRYYRLDVAGGEYVVLSATFDTVLHAELLVRHGEFPTRSDYDHAAVGLYDLQREITLPRFINGAYYLYLHGRKGAGAGRPVTLYARETPLALYRATPGQIGNSGEATLRLEGLNFGSEMEVALVQNDRVIRASALRVEDEQTAFVTFDLKGVATGHYTVRLRAEVEVTLSGAVEIVDDAGAEIWFQLVGPGRIRPGRSFEFTLEYGNRGGADALAPWITVGVNEGLTWRVKNGHTINGVHFDLLAISPDGSPGVLRPGQRHQVTFQATSGSVSPFIQAWIADEIQLLSAETLVQRFGGDPKTAPWDGITAALDAQLGQTYADYLNALHQLATHAATVNNREYSIDALLQRAVADLWLAQLIVFTYTRSDASDMCEGSAYDPRFNGSGSRLPDGRWVPYPAPRPPTFLEMVEYAGEVTLRKHAVAVVFGLRQEWLEWIDMWESGAGQPWVGAFESRIAKEMLKHLMTPQRFDVVQIDELSIWGDINNRIAFQDTPFGDVPFGEAAFNFEMEGRENVDFANYIIPKPGDVKWSFGGSTLYYPMTPGGNWTPVRVETTRYSLNPAGDIVHWTVRNMPMRVVDEFDLDEHVVNKQARSLNGRQAHKGDPVWFYEPFYMLQTFGDARCMKWIVNLVLPEYKGKTILAGVEADAGEDRTIMLPRGQTHVDVTLHGSAKIIKTRLATESDNVKPFDWGGVPVAPADEQNPTVRLSRGTYIFTLNVNGFGNREPYTGKAYTDFDSVTVRVVKSCREGDPKCPPPLHIGFVTSWDPNDIVGPAGFGVERFVTPAETFPYTILFENKAEATAPAQKVFITHQLSSNLDWSTFELGSFGFGDLIFDLPGGRNYYQTRLDLVDELGFHLDLEAGIDLQTGLAFWTFRTIDPETGDLIGDALAGFLPPNRDAPEGEGFVIFSVQPKADLNTGAQIDAQAHIIFDTNEPIDTPVYRNVIDATPPTSSVASLPAESASPFIVSWSGGDGNGSGVAAYDVYVRENEGEWMLWQEGARTTSANFTGAIGSSYTFYSVAVDNVGQREQKAPAAEAGTTITSQANWALHLPVVMTGKTSSTPQPVEQFNAVYLPLVGQ